MAPPLAPPPRPRAHYPQPTEAAFERALAALAKDLPGRHAALSALLTDGRFHDVDAIVAVLEGGAP